MPLVRQRNALPRLPASGTPDRRWFENLLRTLEELIRIGAPRDLVTFEMIQPEVPTVGLQDGVNTVFTIPFEIAMNPSGKPLAQLRNGNALVMYSMTDPPPAGFWHLRSIKGPLATTQQVILGTPPGPTDNLCFCWLFSA